MALDSPTELFRYELSGALDAEKKATAWRDEIAGQLRDSGLQQIARTEQQEGHRRIENLEACFAALGARAGEVSGLTVDGARAEFKQFMSQQPAPDTREIYAVGSLLKMSHVGVAAYRGLVDKALAMGQARCAQLLRRNLVMKADSIGRLERISYELSERVMATA
ncbi:DUF892 family protein [Planosporangium thailandense]|uniref:DUF892 family protein n=1 Tax=Planosporangium thailandense TaxID=765197 RepID=A0ABX0Y7V7_9ACTN|nr:DUF892 family protein [Planosporangium thailandense]NJC74171.1 DUF892 family protein [Planosporangium thailandense]